MPLDRTRQHASSSKGSVHLFQRFFQGHAFPKSILFELIATFCATKCRACVLERGDRSDVNAFKIQVQIQVRKGACAMNQLGHGVDVVASAMDVFGDRYTVIFLSTCHLTPAPATVHVRLSAQMDGQRSNALGRTLLNTVLRLIERFLGQNAGHGFKFCPRVRSKRLIFLSFHERMGCVATQQPLGRSEIATISQLKISYSTTSTISSSSPGTAVMVVTSLNIEVQTLSISG